MANLDRCPSYVLFGLCFFALFTIGLSSHKCQRVLARIADGTYSEHPETYWGAANFLPGYERCWCRGFKVGSGLVRSSRTRRDHSNKEKELIMSNYDKIRRAIGEQWLTLQFLEIHRELLANSLGGWSTNLMYKSIGTCLRSLRRRSARAQPRSWSRQWPATRRNDRLAV